MSNTIYCTYLTTYSGDKLPPLYIGSTSTNNINKGYRGSVKSKKYKQIWKSELEENPHLFETKILTTHSTREEAFEEEVRYQLEHNVVRSSEYINMALANRKLIFYDHNDIKYKKKLSEAQKKRFESEEARKKHSEATKKGMTEEVRKKRSEYGRKRYEDGFIHPFFGKSHSLETKEKMSLARKQKTGSTGSKNGSYGRKWFYNPETLENIKCLPDDRPENFIPGRKIKK